MQTAGGPLLDGVGPVAGFEVNLAETWEYYEL